MPRATLTATQGAANAFVEASLVTSLTGQTTIAWQVQEIVIELGAIEPAPGAGDDLEVALTRRSKSAMPNIGDIDVFFKHSESVGIVTSGAVFRPDIIRYQPTRELFLVEDPIYIQVDSTGYASATTVVAEIFYELVSISAIDRLTLLTQSLTE